MSASAKPRSSMTRPKVTYMPPMRLWSTPSDELNAAFIGKLRTADGARIGRPVPLCERQRRQDHGNHNHEHDRGEVDEEQPLSGCDWALRVEDPSGAAAERRGTKRDKSQYTVAHTTPHPHDGSGRQRQRLVLARS